MGSSASSCWATGACWPSCPARRAPRRPSVAEPRRALRKLPLFKRPEFAELKRAALISLLTTLAFLIPSSLAMAQAINVDLGSGAGLTDRVVQLIGLLTVLSLAPSIVIMTTSFVRIVVVLSLLRQALGLQQTPPNAVIISLSLFL